MSTNVAAMKSMIDQSTTEVRWGGGGFGYRAALVSIGVQILDADPPA